MTLTQPRQVEFGATATDTNEHWRFWVEVDAPLRASLRTVARLAHQKALAQMEQAGIAISSLEVFFIAPVD